MPGNPTLPTENIDEVILGLLSLEPNEIDELDYETYKSYLRELLVEITEGKRKIDSSETDNIKNEFKRVRVKKGRFRIKKTKITTTGLGLGGIRKQVKRAQNRLMLVPVGGVPKQTSEVALKGKDNDSSVLVSISNTFDSILSTLTNINSQNKARIEKERRSVESGKRGLKEKELESKSVEGIKKIVSATTKPFQSIWDTIVNFITNIILGRIVLKLIDWFGKEENQKKIQSIIRFFKDHWPVLLALYLRFGTSIGRFVGRLTGFLIKGAIKIGAITTQLALKAGLGRAGGKLSKVAGFLGGPRGKLLGAGLGIAADVAITAGASKAIEGFAGGEAKVPGFSGGGFSGGIKNLFGNIFNGMVKGPGGSKDDKIPAMLSNGEFVMSAGAVQKYGVDTLESMNAAGGGTNVPRITDGMTYAFGGGFVGDNELYRMAANHNRGMNLPEIPFDSNNTEHSKTFERLKKVAIRRGVYKPPSGTSYAKPNINVDVKPNYKPTSSTSIVRSPGTGLSTNVKPPVQRINTNMNVPGGRIRGGSLSAIMAAFEMKQRKDEGQTNVQAGLGAGGAALGGQLGWMAGAKAGAIAGAALGSIVPGLGTGVGAAVGAIVGGLAAGYGGAMLGGKLADDFSGVNAAKERASRGVGGNIVGGYGLKAQSFKDAPKTSIITDDKGRPFVGHKALRNGKLTYVRSSAPGTGTSNPLEMLGRFINPSAYKDNDAKLARQKHKEAMVNSLEGFQRQGMAPDAQVRMMKQMGGNLKDTQNDLNYRKKMSISGSQTRKPPVKPLPRRRTKADVIGGGGMGGKRGSGSNPSSSATKPPSFSAKHHKGNPVSASAYGIMR